MIRAAGLRYVYPGAESPAIDGLDFEVSSGEILGFLGPNGAGKSTTQKVLIGLLRDYEGDASVLGRSPGARDSDFYEHIGVAFEFPNHYLKLTGRENLTYFGALYERGGADPDELLKRVDLADAGDMPVARYSKGMKSRLSIARALLNDPEVLFLDEPTAGLDPVSARRIKELIGAQRNAGKTVFLTTHDMVVADELCDRVAFIVDGRIDVIDAPRSLKLAYGERTVRVEHGGDGALERSEFPLAGLGENRDFLELLRKGEVETLHTLEASLETVFVEVTGRELG
ncbi:MAG: ABC transporter ATP-binding protein [Gemmatimonadota bacterium]|nr:ABC transporter ATP-binding protein [Gemmatimonadota bacterium]